MLKNLIIPFNLLVVLVMNFVFNGSVDMKMKVPSEVVAGDEFTVEITMNKGDLTSFARFQQYIPTGIKVKAVETSNGEFSYRNNNIKLIWLRLPENEELTVVYTLQADQRLMGEFDLGGSFSYIASNERKKDELPAKAITIQPSPFVQNSIDINEFQDFVNNFNKNNQKVLCVREYPKPTANGEILVNLLVDKGDKEKFAKIQENIPEGFIAEEVETKDGIFTFKNQQIKFLWMNLPADPYFVVSYKLIPTNGARNFTNAIQGSFSYVENNITHSVEIVQKQFNLNSASEEQIADFIKQTKEELPAQELEMQFARAQEAIAASTSPAVTDIEVPEQPEEPVVEETKPVEEKTEEKSQPAVDDILNDPRYRPYLLEPESGVYYRVQVAAGHTPVVIKRYFNRLKLDDDVRIERHEGWYKYSVGSFYDYRSARDHRVSIWESTPIDDAFVAAYNDGTRITVQEALMIANHEWFR